MTKRIEADRVVETHVIWSMGAGLIPLPLFDIAAVTAVQMDMLQQLANLYETDYSKSMGKTFVTALSGSTLARLGATLVKAIPGVGSIVGGLSMSALSGTATYAVGQVAINHLEAGGDFLNVDLAWARGTYDEAVVHGKTFVSNLEKEIETQDVLETLAKLGQLREKGVLTEAEFETQKQRLLQKLAAFDDAE